MQKGRWADLRPQLRDSCTDQGTVLIKRQRRHLDHAPASSTALWASFHQCRTCRACCNHFCFRLHVINRLHPLIPITGILDLVKKVIAILFRIHIAVIAFQQIVQTAQLQHRVVHRNKQDLLRRDTFFQQSVDHLILDRRLANPAGTRQNDRPPQVLLLQPLHRLIVSKPTICLGKARVYHACAPPGIIRL